MSDLGFMPCVPANAPTLAMISVVCLGQESAGLMRGRGQGVSGVSGGAAAGRRMYRRCDEKGEDGVDEL